VSGNSQSGACERCGRALDCPLVCTACGTLREAGAGLDPFAVFGLEPRFEVDAAELRRRLVRLSRSLHPDFFGSSPAEVRALAERNSAELNRAFERLSDDYDRADLLLTARGGPASEAERGLPRSFLLEVLEWNEALEEGRTGEPAAVARALALEPELTALRRATFERVARGLAGGDLGEVRRDLNGVRYLDRALEQLSALRLDRAAPRP
jgi:DnaJ-domain-containing protein 1